MIKCNGIEVKPLIFSDKTSQIWKLKEEQLRPDVNVITWDFENESEFLHIAQLSELLFKTQPGASSILEIPYFPYARQDKPISNESTFALISFCKLLRTLPINSIQTKDIHSRVAFDYLDNLYSNPVTIEILNTAKECEANLIVFPDKGAYVRYSNLIDMKCLVVNKSRDPLTGQLSISGLIGDIEKIKGSNILIVDDLCDAGGTFLLTAQELRKYNPNTVSLYTSHGIYSKGTQIIFEGGIDRIFNLKGEIK